MVTSTSLGSASVGTSSAAPEPVDAPSCPPSTSEPPPGPMRPDALCPTPRAQLSDAIAPARRVHGHPQAEGNPLEGAPAKSMPLGGKHTGPPPLPAAPAGSTPPVVAMSA